MRIEQWRHEGVAEDGKCGGGAVTTGGSIRFSSRGGGCDLKNCHCSDGHWVCIGFPRTNDGVVEGVTIWFDNEIQLLKFLEDFEMATKERKHHGV